MRSAVVGRLDACAGTGAGDAAETERDHASKCLETMDAFRGAQKLSSGEALRR